jgi:hypothetical protein
LGERNILMLSVFWSKTILPTDIRSTDLVQKDILEPISFSHISLFTNSLLANCL